MRSSKINSAMDSRKEPKKKLKSFVKSNNPGNCKRFKPIKYKEKKSRVATPSSHNRSSNESNPCMVVSQSEKHRVGLKEELCSQVSVDELHLTIQKLNLKVRKLEKENKKLRDENRNLKGIHSHPHSQKPPGSHYKPHCKKIKEREDSRSSLEYNGHHFNNTNQFSDFTRSYSFENNKKIAIRSADADNLKIDDVKPSE